MKPPPERVPVAALHFLAWEKPVRGFLLRESRAAAHADLGFNCVGVFPGAAGGDDWLPGNLALTEVRPHTPATLAMGT